MSLKALSLGGQVLCLWGGCGCEALRIIGEHGVRQVMKGLLADLDILMNVAAGCQSRVSIRFIGFGWKVIPRAGR